MASINNLNSALNSLSSNQTLRVDKDGGNLHTVSGFERIGLAFQKNVLRKSPDQLGTSQAAIGKAIAGLYKNEHPGATTNQISKVLDKLGFKEFAQALKNAPGLSARQSAEEEAPTFNDDKAELYGSFVKSSSGRAGTAQAPVAKQALPEHLASPEEIAQALKEVKAQEAKNPTPPPRNESLRSPAKQALPEHLASPEEIAQALQGLNGKGKGPEKTATAAARLSSAASHGREIVKNQTAPAKTASAASATTSAAAASAPKKAATSNASNTPQALNLVKNLKAGAITDATFLKEVFPLIQNRLGEKAGDIINTRSNQYYHHLGAKARYTDIGAPKETIVSLKSGDLIHANFVSVGGLGKPAIATQAPKAETIKDFVTLIQEQNITTIIDLTNTNDKQTRKIPDYARQPQHGFESTDKTTSELKNSSIEKRELKTGPNQHKVDYLNLTTWPDHGVVDLGTLSNLIAAIGQEHGNKSGGLVIHCTAGVGRTGTVFAGVELSRLAKNGELTKDNFAEKVLDVVAEGRKARGNAFVQAPGQLDLLFDYAQSLVR